MNTTRTSLSAVVLTFLVSACATQQGAEQTAPADTAAQAAKASAEPVPPKLRLSGDARPIDYRVTLALDPRRSDFSGEVEIDTELVKPQRTIWLHAEELEVSEATLRDGSGAEQKLAVLSGHSPFLGLRAERELPAGKVTLALKFSGTYEERGAQGLFRQNERGEWYAFTQFEAEYARRAFPSFDEPSYKVPFTIVLQVPEELAAFSNNPIEDETAGPREGWKTVRFKQTPPLPTYLVAFAVGPFEVVDAGTGGQKNTPLRIIVTKGKKELAKYAAEDLQKQLAPLEDYFGQPYPYEKLDLLEIPLTGTFGAMENPGLVTFVASLMLADPRYDTIDRQRRFARVNAHELAHQWFGNLVTPAWWDDIWLNEAFATWMARKAIEAREPDWDIPLQRVQSLAIALSADALLAARQIRQPIHERGDIVNAFDRITYEKGGAVLDMFENHLGAERFREGVRRYIAAHADGVATADDFFSALSDAAGKDVKAAANSFIAQPGSPLVSFTLECAEGAAPKLKLTQQRYVELGAPAEKVTAAKWSIPVCVRHPIADGKTAEACTLLGAERGELALSEAKSCPAWVFPNAKAKGYYRSLLEGELLAKVAKVAKQELSGPEQMMLLLDGNSAMRAGMLPAERSLALVEQVLPSEDRGVIETAVRQAADLDFDFIPADAREHHVRMVRKLFGQLATKIGVAVKPTDTAETRLLREEVISAVALRGEDPKLVKQARELGEKWLETPAAVSPDLAESLLAIAAAFDDGTFNEQLREELGNTEDRRAREYILTALGHTRSPEIAKQNLPLLLDPKVDPRESIDLVRGLSQHPQVRDVLYAYVKENYDAYAARFTPALKLRIPTAVALSFCDREKRADVEAFFGERTGSLPGGERVLAQTLERIDACIAIKEKQAASVKTFLQKF